VSGAGSEPSERTPPVAAVVVVFLLLFAGVAMALSSGGSGIDAHPADSEQAPGASRDSDPGA